MRSCICWLVVGVAIVGSSLTLVNAEEPRVQALEWNVFLSDWELLGPFPKEDANATGLDTQFVKDEANLRGGQVSFYQNKLFTWKPYDERVINFRKALKVQGARGDHVVAYAWTQFTSPVAQKAVLSVGYDDVFAAWVNGQEICRGLENSAACLDQQLGEVTLRAGVNTLLLKVGQGIRAWDAVARFLPAGLAEPLLTFRCQPGGDITRLPTVHIALVDARGATISEHRCSGLRKSWPGNNSYYALYAAMPNPPPKEVRFTLQEPGLEKVDQRVTWNRARSGNVALLLAADRPLELLVVDQSTRRPIAGAEVSTNLSKESAVSDARGRITLADFSPMANQCWIAARGYAARRLNVAWPRGNLQRAELTPGGRTVAGTVRSTTGQPLAGATIKSGVAGYSPEAVTDESGRFELFGLPDTTTQIYPVVTCRGYVSKDRFFLDLDKGPMTNVIWELAPGATITGRVTHRETGEPLAGVTITRGESRYASNNDSPTAKTGADGRFELTGIKPGTGLVHAFSDNYAPALISVTASVGKPVEVDFQLSEGKPATGVITDPAGKPLAGVWLVTEAWNGARMFRREARTDNAGQFTLAHMPDIPAEVSILKSGYVSQRNFRMQGGDTVKLQLKPSVTHTIEVRDAVAGRIVAELQISKGYLWKGNQDWHWSSSEWETDRLYDKQTGILKFQIDEAMDAEIAFRFRATGYQPEVVAIPLDAAVGKQFDVRLKAAEVFEGRVVDAASGTPLSGVTVAIVNREDRMRSDHYVDFLGPAEFLKNDRFTGQRTVTDQQGRFRLSPPTSKSVSELVLVGEHGGFQLISGVDAILRSAADRDGPLELALAAAGSIEGRLIVAGKPVGNARVHLQWVNHGHRLQQNESFGVGGQVATDSEGRFRFSGLGPGRYRLSRVFSAPLGEGSSTSMYLDSMDVVLLPGETHVENLEKPAGLSASGIVRDPAGNPVSQCIVTATVANDHERLAAALSDEKGRFVLEHLPPGTYTLSAEHYGRHPEGYYDHDMRGTATVELATSHDHLKIELEPISRGRAAPASSGSLAPEFTVTPHGATDPFTLSQHFGKVVAISFWGPWSNDLAGIQAAFEKYKDHSEVAILTVFQQDEDQLEAFLKKQRVAFPVAVATEEQSSISIQYGEWGNTSSVVIGRDGRIAAGRLSGEQLAGAIERALSQPLDATLKEAEPARLSVTLAADDSQRGVPGAKVVFKAVDASGRTVRQDTASSLGAPRQLLWRYPNVENGGHVAVTVSGRGITEQTQKIERPSSTEKMHFAVASPRAITGRIVASDTAMAAVGMQVKLAGGMGESRSTKTDAMGRFKLPCFPGTYYLTVVGDGRYAMAATNSHTVNVQDAVDPEPIEWKASPATTIRGLVVDPAGKPVAGATVQTQQGIKVTTDDAGKFSLEGVATIGMTQIWAMSDDVYGAVRVNDPQPDESHTITLGSGLNETNAAGDPAVGSPVSPFDAWTLDGEKVAWQPVATSERLLILCALWHPESKAFIQKAQQWAAQQQKQIELVSLDWNLEQAGREAKRLGLTGRVLFAGPGCLRLGEAWPLEGGRAAMLINPNGTLAAIPVK